jgi:hypothetical protein
MADTATDNELAAGKADEAPPVSIDSSSSSCVSSSSSCVSSSSNGPSTTLVSSLPTPAVCAAALMTSPVKLPPTADGEVTSPVAAGEELMTSAPLGGEEGQIYYMLVDENSQLENQTILIGRRSSECLPFISAWENIRYLDTIMFKIPNRPKMFWGQYESESGQIIPTATFVRLLGYE